MLGDMLPPCRHSKVGYFSANSAPGVLMEKERYKAESGRVCSELGAGNKIWSCSAGSL